MKLEIERLRLNLSAAERDRALLSIGIDPATINPNALIDELYMGRLCRVANTLALLGQASLEDKRNAAIGLGNVDDNIIDFWNITGIGGSCSGSICEVHAEATAPAYTSSVTSPVGASQSILICSECGRKVCEVCCAGRGALLLMNSNLRETTNYNGLASQGGSSHGSQIDSSTSRTVPLDSVICKQCCRDIVLDALILDYLRVLISLRRRDRADSAAYKALDHVIGSPLRGGVHEKISSSDSQQAAKALQKLLSGGESLAEFPLASFLHSVWSFLLQTCFYILEYE